MTPEHVAAARALEHAREADRRARRSRTAASTCASAPRSSTATTRSATVEGAFNAVMLQGDAIREITLEGPGAGGIETASAVVADMVSIVGTTGTGFLQNDPVWRDARADARRASSRRRATCGSSVEDRAGVLAPARAGARRARASRSPGSSSSPATARAVLHVVTHEAPAGRVEAALAAIRALPESRGDAERAARRLRPRRRRARLGVDSGEAVTITRSSSGSATGSRSRRRHPVVIARRGLDAAAPAPRLSRAARRRALAQVGGVQPDRLATRTAG